MLIDGDDERIVKEPILWRPYQHNMFYVVTVPGGTVVRKHQHDENIFRFIGQGSLTPNRKHKINAGTWFVVKANNPYELTTEKGYMSIAGYVSICRTNRGVAGTHLVKTVRAAASKKIAGKKVSKTS